MSDDFFAAPPFKADESLQRLQRDLRDLGLSAREGRWERKGISIARAAVDGAAIKVAVVRRPSRNSPEWQERTLKSSADIRDFVADLKKKLAAWTDHDD